jgi:hypothetical protein
MNDKCIEIGTIQAFLDGETSPELSFTITNHTANCDNCALLLAQAEEENSQVFAMLDRELDTLVPTQRLWSNINVALAEEKSRASFWDKLRAGVLVAFGSPSLTVAASVVVLVTLFAAVWTLRSPNTGNGDMIAAGPSVSAPAPAQPTQSIAPTSGPATEVGVTNYSPKELGKLAQQANYRPERIPVRAEPAVVKGPAVEQYLPGEESYIRTIADLKENVENRKDAVMSPSVRVSFERDLAVVDDSIKKMKDVVRKNPKNQAAKQVLYSSYQNKIDLLNSIAEREELMASMQ